ncbi:hypothetical protein [Winogradskyella sp. 3972H.M.0a.05]|uniref:hypothetical protein n=1 Tax=Winogradskyella sp. 3972H.M.0a.05 TaxID=2950277 RepID=UPI00339B6147
MKRLLLILVIVLVSCNNNPKKEAVEKTNSKTTISGNSKELIGATVYLKDNNHFNFLTQDFIIDSTVVDSVGNFKFTIDLKESMLVKIDSSSKNIPGTLQVFKMNPDLYQYLLCKNFLAYHPTLFVEPSESYTINTWSESHDLDAVVYEDENHNFLRRYYTENPYYEAVRHDRKLRDLEIKEAWQRVSKVKDSLITVLNLNGKIEKDSFNHYLKSEIVLGASNWFFNWFDGKEFEEFNNQDYQEALSIYFEEEWNKYSLHYFKLTERVINTKLNEKYGSFKVYYEPSQDKLETALQYAGENIKEQYTLNIENVIK